MKHILAIILGGGRGTRLEPLTNLRAKPAVPLAGKYRLIDIPVSNCINSGIHKIYVLTQFNSASLNRHISHTYQFSPFTDGFVEILAAQQTPKDSTWFQGTADAVRQYLEAFSNFKVEQFLILSGDHLYRVNYQEFIREHQDSDADMSISVVPVASSRAGDFGLLKINRDGWITDYREKPKGKALHAMRVDTSVLGLETSKAKKLPYIASMGIYVFNRRTLIDLLTKFSHCTDFGKEIIPQALKTCRVKACLHKGYWEDIGTIKSFYQANMNLVKFPHPVFNFYDSRAPIYTRQRFLPPTKCNHCIISKSLICEGCIIDNAEIHNSIIGIRTQIHKGCKIEKSLILGADYYQSPEELEDDSKAAKPPLGIDKNCHIVKAIVDKNVRIGKNVLLINKNKIQNSDKIIKGVSIKSGIIIVKKNSTIPNGTVV
jgi:glucose-1-phosphate adenylyltransferase